ncbi:MAG: hypothetical protein ABIG42_00760 [bacterium]
MRVFELMGEIRNPVFLNRVESLYFSPVDSLLKVKQKTKEIMHAKIPPFYESSLDITLNSS